MTTTTLDERMSAALAATLEDASWLSPQWDAASRDFAARLALGCARGLAGSSLEHALAAAYEKARAATPVAYPRYHETWTCVVMVLVARELVRSTPLDAVLGEVSSARLQAALELARTTRALALRSPGESFKLHALERVVGRARKALLAARNRSDPGPPAGVFTFACADQVSHALSLFMAREARAEVLVRDAVLAADAAARRQSTLGWSRVAPSRRRAVAQRCLVELAAALVLCVPDLSDGTGDMRDAGLWLARTAVKILACADRVEAWFPDAAPETAPAPHDEPTTTAPPGATEAAMKDNPQNTLTTTVLKTLQTDAMDAAWRTAGSQFVKLAREPLVGLLSRHLAPGDDALRARVAAFLETELGTALLAALLSVGLSSVPSNAGDVPRRLARELRVRALADTGDLVADVLMGPLRQVVAMHLQDVGPMLVAAEPEVLLEPAPRASATPLTVAVPDAEPVRR